MNKEEFLGKLQLCYFGDRNAFDEIVELFDKMQKENKILRENAEHNDKVVDKVNWENKQLKNNIDKAIKKLNKYRNRKDHYGLWCMEYIDNADIIHILKGGNNEK